jgi:ABC-type glutathione transport system ATPase component
MPLRSLRGDLTLSANTNELVRVDHLVKTFPLPRTPSDLLRRRNRREVRAVDDVSFTVNRGEILGIVGESGSGKSTLARCLVGLTAPDAGVIHVADTDARTTKRIDSIHARVQIVFQDPYAALNPRLTIGSAIGEALYVHHRAKGAAREARINELLELVGLSTTLKTRRPRQLSGGQRQRAVIARALAVEPEILVADEAVSALDVSVQAQILNLLLDLRDELRLTIVFISHQLSVVSYICDRVAVMRDGRFVEVGATRKVYAQPRNEYTRALLAAHPDPTQTRAANA